MNWSITPGIDHPFFFAAMDEGVVEENVMDCVQYIHKTYGESLTAGDMESAFEMYDLDYSALPKYLKAEFDYFDIVD